MTPALRPEDELLRCCARTELTAAHAERLRTLVAGPLDWSRVVAAAEGHGMAPLVHLHLSATVPGAAPPATLRRLAEGQRAVQLRNLRLTGVASHLLDLFARAGLAAVTYKGPTLAQTLYGNLALRPFGDIDLLVAHRDVLRARHLLVQHGYRAGEAAAPADARAETAGQFLFQDADGAALVELHSERTLRHFPRPLDAGWLLDGACAVRVAGRELLTLPPVKLLLALSVHGTKDLWCRLKWICDIAEFVRVYRALDWSEVFAHARRLGCQRMLGLALVLARDVLGAPLPPACARALAADPGAEAAAGSLRRRFPDPAAQLSAPGRFWFRARVCPGSWEGLRYALRLATTPAEEDWAATPLPATWTPLYALLRPLRLLRKYGVTRRL